MQFIATFTMLSKFPDLNTIQRKPITRFLNSLIADMSCLKRNRRIVNLVNVPNSFRKKSGFWKRISNSKKIYTYIFDNECDESREVLSCEVHTIS